MQIEQEVIDIREMALKCTSKSEVYMTLTVFGGLYLPPKQDCNCDYISDLMEGRKFCFTGEEIKNVKVPQIKGLTLDDIVSWARTKTDINAYIPEYKTERYPNRTWLCNKGRKKSHLIVSTLLPEEFEEFIQRKMQNREQLYSERRNMMMKTSQRFSSIFKNSTMYFRANGRFFQLVKNSHSRRLRNKEQEEKEEEYKELKTSLNKKNKEIKKLMTEIEKFQDQQKEQSDYGDKLNRLFKMGLIDKEGDPTLRKDEDMR